MDPHVAGAPSYLGDFAPAVLRVPHHLETLLLGRRPWRVRSAFLRGVHRRHGVRHGLHGFAQTPGIPQPQGRHRRQPRHARRHARHDRLFTFPAGRRGGRGGWRLRGEQEVIGMRLVIRYLGHMGEERWLLGEGPRCRGQLLWAAAPGRGRRPCQRDRHRPDPRMATNPIHPPGIPPMTARGGDGHGGAWRGREGGGRYSRHGGGFMRPDGRRDHW